MKMCTKCQSSRKNSDFSTRPSRRDMLHSWCKECNRLYAQWYRRENKLKHLIICGRYRAKKLGREFTITESDLEQPDICPVLGIPLDYQSNYAQNPNNATIDRIDNNKGYTPDNCLIISYRANRLKSNATIEELEKVLAYMKFYA